MHYTVIANEVYGRWPALFRLNSPKSNPAASVNRAMTDTNQRYGLIFRHYGEGTWGLWEWDPQFTNQ